MFFYEDGGIGTRTVQPMEENFGLFPERTFRSLVRVACFLCEKYFSSFKIQECLVLESSHHKNLLFCYRYQSETGAMTFREVGVRLDAPFGRDNLRRIFYGFERSGIAEMNYATEN